jgi:hypothetical protein
MAIANILHALAAGTVLMTTPVAMPGTCRMTKPPVININPVTAPIQYDRSQTSAQLSAMQSGTISPYGLDVDQATGGLRQDQPMMKYEIKYHILSDPNSGTFCMSYGQIDVDIRLQPKIYIAKEYDSGQCGKEVIEHEKKHVRVDRHVINKYARAMGIAVQKAVNSAGVVGPFPNSQVQSIRADMQSHIDSALNSIKLLMINEMNQYQQQVDSLEEYERVSKFCEKQRETVFKNRQR